MTVLAMILVLTGAALEFTWTSDAVPETVQGPLGTRVVLEGAVPAGAPGTPLIPVVPLTVLLPAGAVARSVEVTAVDEHILEYDFLPMPAQRGVPLSMAGTFTPAQANPEAYRRPINMGATLQGQGTLMGYPVADILLMPFSWDEGSGELAFAGNVTVVVHYDFQGSVNSIPSRGIAGTTEISSIMNSAVANPGGFTSLPAASLYLPWGEYFIIADDGLAGAFEPLAEFKTWKGVEARIVTISTITDLYSGVDDAQKLRNFLFDIYQDSPPTYILLAGDTPGIPHRNCYATAEGYTGDPSSDLYYQDMNDTAPGVDAWDLDGDGTWGELNGNDNMDYHPDYILGRASVETVSEAEIFVDKVLAFENTPDTDAWYTSMGFTTGILWSSPYCPGSAGKEKVDTLYTPGTWTITKLYESAGSQSYAATMAMLNTGMQLVNHAGHGSESSVSIGSGYLGNSDFMGLTNISANGRPTIWNTIACLSGSFDTGTCLAEAWIRSPGGGGFCIMNTRYGWGEPAEPGDQWSELVDQEFFAKFFTEDMYTLGTAFMMAKDEFIPLIPSDTHYDWIAKSNVLFGDPELPMYSQVPQDIEVGDVFLSEGLQTLNVTVSSQGSPLEGARVCLIQGDWEDPETYAVGLTDGAGSVTLTWPEPMPGLPDEARLTVWARDHHLNSQVHTVYNMGTGGESGSVISMTLNASNPVSGQAAISWTLPAMETATLTIVDLAGRTVATQALETTEGVFSWNSSENPAGVYFVRMTTGSGTTIKRRMAVVR